MKNIIVLTLLGFGILGFGIYVSGCGTASSPSANVYSTATLTHSGFDFVTGQITDEAGYDGDTINWNPDTITSTIEGTTYPGGDVYIWWRGAFDTDPTTYLYPPHQKHIGAVALSTITSIPTSWDSGSNIMPLLAGHSYVVKCTPEGYAKFYVISVTTEAQGDLAWPAAVEYYFTTGSSFDK